MHTLPDAAANAGRSIREMRDGKPTGRILKSEPDLPRLRNSSAPESWYLKNLSSGT